MSSEAAFEASDDWHDAAYKGSDLPASGFYDAEYDCFVYPPDLELTGDGPDAEALRDGALDHIVNVHQHARVLIADQYRTIAEVLRDAAADPTPWVGRDRTLDPDWEDPRGRTVAAVRRDRADMAVRAAAADIAVRVRMSESTVRSRAYDAETLRERCPRVWAAFLGGEIGEANVRTAAAAADSLPSDAPDSWAEFDQQVVGSAARLTPAKFRPRARVVRDRVHPQSLQDRHRRAAEGRDVWVTPEHDGMATVIALVPAADAHATMTCVDATARHLHDQPGETRTLAQLRADAFSQLTTTLTGDAVGTAAPAVAITVPAMTLLGAGDAPAMLDGYGPIDLDTAKRLAGTATSWVRILTHPITGTVMNVDRTTYRVPAALRRWLGVQHPTCVFPGCNRRAADCDIDHRVEWQYGGATAADNLAPECTPHHRIKTETQWKLDRDDDSGQLSWISPTGVATDADPPPW